CGRGVLDLADGLPGRRDDLSDWAVEHIGTARRGAALRGPDGQAASRGVDLQGFWWSRARAGSFRSRSAQSGALARHQWGAGELASAPPVRIYLAACFERLGLELRSCAPPWALCRQRRLEADQADQDAFRRRSLENHDCWLSDRRWRCRLAQPGDVCLQLPALRGRKLG